MGKQFENEEAENDDVLGQEETSQEDDTNDEAGEEEEAPPAPSAEDSEEEDEDGEGESEEAPPADGVEEEEEPAFQFDRKIKVMDDEVEIPEHIAAAIQNEEQFKEVKELYEKAHGLEPLKQKRDYFKEQASTWETKHREVAEQYKEINENLDFLDKLIKDNDLQTFQKYAEISDDQVLQRAAQIIEYRELTPAQKAEYDRNVQSRQRLYDAEAENRRLSQASTQSQVESDRTALEAVLSGDDVRDIASQFDERMGEGAFMKEVVQRAAYKEKFSGQSMSPEEAVKEVVTLLGLSQGQREPQTEQTPETTPKSDPSSTVVVRKKPTIPKSSGGAKSPARPIVKSLDDIRKMADTMDY